LKGVARQQPRPVAPFANLRRTEHKKPLRFMLSASGREGLIDSLA
jgi:hypothetical protein